MSLDGRVALVTGGAGHIGRAIGHALAELGAEIAVVDLSQSGAEAAANELSQRWPVAAAGFACDLEQSEQVRDLPRQVRERFGRIDIIVNCAAFVGTSGLEGWAVPFEQQSDKTWRRALEVNLTAPFVLVQAAAADLKASGHGSVINISSIYGLSGPEWRLYEGTNLGNPAAYAASKGGADPGHPLALHDPGAARPGQCHCTRRRVSGHPRAVPWPLYGPHPAWAHGMRGRLQGGGGLFGDRFIGIRDRPVPGGRRWMDRVVMPRQIMKPRESWKC
jgi:hypothetical protein